jgi:HD-like signal output (HDOD) protein
LEAECFGASHAELGAYLLGLWGLDEGVVESIAHHHCPLRRMPVGRVTAVVYAANAIEHRLSADRPETPADAFDPAIIGQLNIADRLAGWEEACRRHRREGAVDAG